MKKTAMGKSTLGPELLLKGAPECKGDLVARIKELGCGHYLDVRELKDGTIIGVGRLLYTTAIFMDMNLSGWGGRFCFEDHELALSEYRKLATGDDEPTGWIARR